MRYKYFFIVVIAFLIVIVAVITYFKLSQPSEYEGIMGEVNQSFEDLIVYCKDNQEEIAAVSDEILLNIKPNASSADLQEVERKIENPDWARLSETLQFNCPADEPEPNEKVYYHYQSFELGQYGLWVLYMDAAKEEVEEYISRRFQPIIRVEKINEHLYVCLIEQQQV